MLLPQNLSAFGSEITVGRQGGRGTEPLLGHFRCPCIPLDPLSHQAFVCEAKRHSVLEGEVRRTSLASVASETSARRNTISNLSPTYRDKRNIDRVLC